MRFVPIIALLFPALAYADDSTTERPNRPRVGASAGLGTPFGDIGIEYTQPMLDQVEVGLGVGRALSGYQAFLMPRFRSRGGTVDFGIGPSVGRYEKFELFPCGLDSGCTQAAAIVLWTNAEIGLSVVKPSGFFVRVFGGFGVITARGQCATGAMDCGSIKPGSWLPSLGFTLGTEL